MIKQLKKQGLVRITVVYWFLLIYIIAALVWWYIALQHQNTQIARLNELMLNTSNESYHEMFLQIENNKSRKSAQYIGEGFTFLLLILTGAVFVYRATRKQIKLAEQQQNFMMAVTHELKTPITIAQLNLETLQKHRLDEEKQQNLISLSLEETNRLSVLTNNILTASQLESGIYHINKQEINFSQLVAAISNDFIKRFPQRHIQLSVKKEIFIEGETALLQLLLNNLIGNALKYSSKEKNIFIRLDTKNGSAILDIIDEGEGINDDEKKKIFEKFYRVGNEEIRTAKGTGLGLYLCKKIVTDHKGKIKVTDNQPQGTIFTVILNAI
jgi:two-component system, OmpR family, sensor histidine kinase CiaH